jgi:hypothetical protein
MCDSDIFLVSCIKAKVTEICNNIITTKILVKKGISDIMTGVAAKTFAD